MSVLQPHLQAIDSEKSEDEAVSTVNEVEAEIREFVRRDGQTLRRPNDAAGELFATNVNTLVQRVAGTSLREIDGLMRELEDLRNSLQSEGERLQRDLTHYAQFSQAALNSIKVNAEALSQWREQVESARLP
jgi:hypothetical protein